MIQDRDAYNTEADRQLSDSTYYNLLDSNPTGQHNDQVTEAVNSMRTRGVINKKKKQQQIWWKHKFVPPSVPAAKDPQKTAGPAWPTHREFKLRPN